jgi:rare lipoprotein A (peptidoglycan hydrolase)
MKFKILLLAFILISCSSNVAHGDYIDSTGMTRKEIEAIRYHPQVQVGVASYYGKAFHKKRTANGEIFDMYKVSAAHKTYPLGTVVKVTNLKNGRSIRLKINDRGPFVKGRVLDLSYEAAKRLGFLSSGTTKVRIEVLKLGNNQFYR